MTKVNSNATVSQNSIQRTPLSVKSHFRHLLLTIPTLIGQRNSVDALASTNLRGAPSDNHTFLGANVESRYSRRLEGKVDCPCIPINATTLAFSEKYDEDRGCLYLREPGQVFCYPLNYGFEGCQSYDQNLPPSCNQEGYPGNPDWCAKSFCYIDPNNCKNTDHFPSTYFKDEGLHYSYKTCGSENTFIGMINDNLDASFMELAAVIERYVVGFRFTLEQGYQAIKEFSDDPSSVAKECGYTDSCDPVLEGSYNQCWDETIDFNNANVVFHPEKAAQAAPGDVNTLACISQSVKLSFLNVAETEHDDSNRIGYIYYGDQTTGGLVLYPEQPFCDNNFDARFRPWYASAVSGPKDVVVVIDTSGSMKNGRIELAKKAASAVLDTLTWADRISLITFNSDIAKVYSEDKLVQSSEENVRLMKDWIEKEFTAEGQTNFMIPLEKAYEILNNNRDAGDQPSCSQAILFLTDGQAKFNEDQMNSLVESSPETVIFSYGLSSDAQQDALQKMACMTNGIYHPVNNEIELPRMMSSYYEYYAKLQDNGKLSWLKYTDAVSGEEIVSGCTPIFNYDKNGITEPDLVGVSCMDLNIIVDLDSLKSCENNAFQHFIDQIFREATRCSSVKSKIEDQCVLQNMRARVDRDSICTDSGQPDPRTCHAGPQHNHTDFSNLDPARFEVIPLNGCETRDSSCGSDALKNNETGNDPVEDGAPKDGEGTPIPMIAGIAVGAGLLMTAAGICYWYRNRSSESNGNPSNSNTNNIGPSNNQSQNPPLVTEQEIPVVVLPPPMNPAVMQNSTGYQIPHGTAPSAPVAPYIPRNQDHRYY